MLWHLTISLCHNTQLYEYNVHHHSCVCSRALVCCIICTMPLQTLHTTHTLPNCLCDNWTQWETLQYFVCQMSNMHSIYSIHNAHRSTALSFQNGFLSHVFGYLLFGSCILLSRGGMWHSYFFSQPASKYESLLSSQCNDKWDFIIIEKHIITLENRSSHCQIAEEKNRGKPHTALCRNEMQCINGLPCILNFRLIVDSDNDKEMKNICIYIREM